jgi:hypothetical protein
MPSPPVGAAVDDVAPTAFVVTSYDQRHMKTYLRLLDAEVKGANWKDVARLVLRIDPARSPTVRALAFETHLARADWAMEGQKGR